MIDTATNTAGPTRIPVGDVPVAIAITPDGKTAYVANATRQRLVDRHRDQHERRRAITVGNEPTAIAITPDGKTAYVTNSGSEHRHPDRHRHQHGGHRSPSAATPAGVAITPDGTTAYVTNQRRARSPRSTPPPT